MDRHATRSVDIPKWSALLVEAVNKPGMIMEAYSAFHNYSIGNQILALVQCHMRGLKPGPINTFPDWEELGRTSNAASGRERRFRAIRTSSLPRALAEYPAKASSRAG